MADDSIQCRHCRFSFRANKRLLVCRRFPPTYHPSHNLGQFPAVTEVEHCGEFEPKKDPYA